LEPGDVAGLISGVAASFAGLDGEADNGAQPVAMTPARVRKSITVEALFSFEDGEAYRSLKRHLTARGLTPQDYRLKWGLPSDYPMVCPAYSAARSEFARSIGLGRGGRKPPKATRAGANRAAGQESKASTPTATKVGAKTKNTQAKAAKPLNRPTASRTKGSSARSSLAKTDRAVAAAKPKRPGR
jgi:predicted transcriptional regulator